MRLHYVAFSSPQKVLVLTAHEQPKEHFSPIWQGLPQWPYVNKELLAAQFFELHERMPIKKTYSFTGDLKIYETCPRQYQFFREYDFTPSRSAVIFFGLLVHQSIEGSTASPSTAVSMHSTRQASAICSKGPSAFCASLTFAPSATRRKSRPSRR